MLYCHVVLIIDFEVKLLVAQGRFLIQKRRNSENPRKNGKNIMEIKQAMLEAVIASMAVVRQNQGGQDEVEVKRNKTLLTATDKGSEMSGLKKLFASLPRKIGVEAEERGKVRVGTGKVLFDPLDGTKPFVIGALSSTVIAAFYDEAKKQVTACIVGEPVSGRVWVAEADKPTVRMNYDFEERKFLGPIQNYEFQDSTICEVSPVNPVGSGATVFLDLYPGFTRKDAKVLSNDEGAKLFSALFGRFGISMLGSNGLHHALVANGAEGVAGAITTAIGGPWDVAPVLLVLQAGGAARAFSIEPSGNFKEQDPLDVFSYHFLVTGNSQETVDELSRVLLSVRD
ncbi:MAG: inositol monophosphatase family protein [bacterium]|nr:inositol monophosphatase family protein [bacterium]